jgi:hypothetical protein
MATERVQIVWVKPQPPTRDHEGARDPARIEAQDAMASVDRFLNAITTDHSVLHGEAESAQHVLLSRDMHQGGVSRAGHDDNRDRPHIKTGNCDRSRFAMRNNGGAILAGGSVATVVKTTSVFHSAIKKQSDLSILTIAPSEFTSSSTNSRLRGMLGMIA